MNNSLDTLEVTSKKSFSSFLKAGSLFAAAALTLAGCASGTTSTTESSAATEGESTETTTPSGDGPFVAIIGGAAFDAFWNPVKAGAESACKAVEAAGGSCQYLALQTYDNLGPDAADLVRDAIGLGADAIAIPNWVPEAEDEAIAEAVAKGIAVIIYNAGGSEAVERLGALRYVGSNEYNAGYAGGEEFSAAGAKHVICVNTTPGATNQESRCQGVADAVIAAGGKSEQLPLPSSQFGDPAAIAQAVKGALIEDPSIDGVITIGSMDSDAAFSGIEQADLVGKVHHGTFDLSENVLARIKDGTQLFAIDQQPFQQGYMAVSMGWQYAQYGILAANDLFTGPGIVSAKNIDAVLNGVALGAR